MPKLAHPEPPVNHSETARLRTISRWLHDLGRAPNNSDLEQLLDILRVLGPLDRKSAARRLQEVALEIQELRDCVTAAADGHPELSERYLAGGALGLRHAEGDWALPLHCSRVEAGQQVHIYQMTNETAVLRRLWIDPALAPHFILQGFWNGQRELLRGGTTSGLPLAAEEGVPATLFERRYGSPLWEEIVEAATQVSVKVANRSEHPRDFRAVVLGCSLELAQKVARGT